MFFRPRRAPGLIALPASVAFIGALLAGCFNDPPRYAGGGIETGNTGSLSGRVLADSGTPMANAEVILAELKLTVDGPVSLTERHAATDDSGRYHFDTLPEGRYALYAPGSVEGRRSALVTRIRKLSSDLELPDIMPKSTVTLVGRILPVTGRDVRATLACIPGVGLCAHPGPDSIYRITGAPRGNYEAVIFQGRSAQYVALQVQASVGDTAFLRDIALSDSADDGLVPYSFYPADLDRTYSGLPIAYPENAQPAWYNGKAFDSVKYFILNDGDQLKEALPTDYLAQWRYSAALQGGFAADAPDLSAPLAGFPVPLRLSAPRFDFTKAAPDGGDIAVSDGQGRLLPIEIEHWDAGAGDAVIWVRLDTLAAKRSDRNLILHWGRPQPLPLSQGSGVFRGDNGFIGVWHLAEKGSGYRETDARGVFTGFLENLGDFDPARLRACEGVLDGCYDFDTTGGYLNVRQQPSLDVSETFTLSLWARSKTAAPGHDQVLVSKWEAKAHEWRFEVAADGNLDLAMGDPSGENQGNIRGTSPVANLDQWHHYALVFDHGTVHMYVDGKDTPYRPGVGQIPRASHLFESDLHLGSDQDAPTSWEGALDEFQYYGDAKSPDWIASLYATQRPTP